MGPNFGNISQKVYAITNDAVTKAIFLYENKNILNIT